MSDIDKSPLVYQPVPAESGDAALAHSLKKVVGDSQSLRIVSPYLSFRVIVALTEGRDFELITDQQACSDAGISADLADFFEEHADSIKSVRGVHAKVVIGEDAALIGSANLTEHGLTKRYEMACEVHEDEQLKELGDWFENLWEVGSNIDTALIQLAREKFSQRRAADGQNEYAEDLSQTGNLDWLARQRSTGTPDSRPMSEEEEIQELAKQLRRFTNTAEEARLILKYFYRAFDQIGLPVEDDRLHMNFGGSKALSITVGQRYVIWVGSDEGAVKFGLLIDDFDIARRCSADHDGVYHRAFTRNHQEEMASLYWPVDDIQNLPQDIIDSWHSGIVEEVERASMSSFRKSKRPSLHKIVRSPELRARVIELAYPS